MSQGLNPIGDSPVNHQFLGVSQEIGITDCFDKLYGPDIVIWQPMLSRPSKDMLLIPMKGLK